MSRTPGEKLNLVLGYLTAMNDVAGTLEAFRHMFSEARATGKMTDEQIGGIAPDYFSLMVQQWNFEDVDIADLTAYVQAIYSEAENRQVGLSNVMEIARDLRLKRITDAEAREKIRELRSRE